MVRTKASHEDVQRLTDEKANKVDIETIMFQVDLLHRMLCSVATHQLESSRQGVRGEHQSELSKEHQ